MKAPRINSLRRYSRTMPFGHRHSTSLNADVFECLDNYCVSQKKPAPLFDEAIYMIKAEIKRLKTAKTKGKNFYSFDQKYLEEAEAMLPKIQKLEKAHLAYAEMFQETMGDTAFAVFG